MFPLTRYTPAGFAKKPPAPPPAKAVEFTFGERWLVVALWVEILTSIFEGPLRYALHLLHLDPVIFARDALMVLALGVYIAPLAVRRKIPVSIGIFFVLAFVHCWVVYFNTHNWKPAAYGVKMFLPALCAFLVPKTIFKPGRYLIAIVVVSWLASFLGAFIDKYWVDYPWVGLSVEIGDVDVSIGRDWQSHSLERVGGLTRSSINLAIIMPLLGFMLMNTFRSWLIRAPIFLMTFAVVFWTTQKGSVLALVISTGALAISNRRLIVPLKAAIVLSAIMMVFAPTVLIQFPIPKSDSLLTGSFVDRLTWMWPGAWAWIDRFPPYLGVGLGGIGGGQRFFSPLDRNSTDNLFVYMYGSCGVASIAYLFAVVLTGVNARIQDYRRDSIALASLVFLLTYGLVISLIEDQIASIWFGATLGWLAQLQPTTRSALLRFRFSPNAALSFGDGQAAPGFVTPAAASRNGTSP